jgi:hypothetical protein
VRYRGEEYSFGGIAGMILAGALFGGPLVLLKAALTAFAVFKLWNWYLAARFGELSFSAAIGIALIGTFITYIPPHNEGDTPDTLIDKTVNPFLMPLLALLAGWVGTFFLT